MKKVTVYNVDLYDVANDEVIRSRRMATLKGIEVMGGRAVEGSAIEIDASQLEPGEEWTARNFNPKARSGFQTSMEA